MSYDAKLVSGILLLVMLTIEFGGSFLLSLLRKKHPEVNLNDFQRSMFRSGHAHAGVLVTLSILAQLLADNASLGGIGIGLVRIGFPLAAVFISAGFFLGAIGKNIDRPTKLIVLTHIGMILLAIVLVVLAIGLLK